MFGRNEQHRKSPRERNYVSPRRFFTFLSCLPARRWEDYAGDSLQLFPYAVNSLRTHLLFTADHSSRWPCFRVAGAPGKPLYYTKSTLGSCLQKDAPPHKRIHSHTNVHTVPCSERRQQCDATAATLLLVGPSSCCWHSLRGTVSTSMCLLCTFVMVVDIVLDRKNEGWIWCGLTACPMPQIPQNTITRRSGPPGRVGGPAGGSAA